MERGSLSMPYTGARRGVRRPPLQARGPVRFRRVAVVSFLGVLLVALVAWTVRRETGRPAKVSHRAVQVYEPAEPRAVGPAPRTAGEAARAAQAAKAPVRLGASAHNFVAGPSHTSVYPPSTWPSCSQPDLERRADAAVAQRLAALEAVRLPPPRRIEPDWEGLARYFEALFHRVPRPPKWAKSLRAFRNARIRYAPEPRAEEVGMLAMGTRLPLEGWVAGKGCRGGWMVLGPRAYVCRRHLVWDKRPPQALHQPQVPEGQVTPGQYAYVRPGGAPLYASRSDVKKGKVARRLPVGFFVRFKRFCRIEGRNYWKTTKNWYIPVDRLARHVPSKFSGVRLDRGGLGLPVAFTLRGKRLWDRPGGRVVGRVPRHAALQVLGVLERAGRRFYRVGPCRWVRSNATRVAWPSLPPPGVRQGEQWVDVNLDTQTLVAYEGTRPVFATLVSTGLDEHPTRHGIFRVYWKIAETDMTSEMGAEEEYMAESVPWSLFFWKGQALHGAYWHDLFGFKKSHGCVNLAPLDARFLYEWARPHLPDGWLYRWTGDKYPGLLVRVRRRDGDLVRFLGLARKFAPKEAVAARDAAYRERIRQETLELLKQAQEAKDRKDAAKTPQASQRAGQAKRARIRPRTGKKPGSRARVPTRARRPRT